MAFKEIAVISGDVRPHIILCIAFKINVLADFGMLLFLFMVTNSHLLNTNTKNTQNSRTRKQTIRTFV